MEEKVIKINADTSDANKEIAKTTKGVESLGKETTETNKTIKKTGETTEKAGKTGSKGVGLLSKGFKGLGTAMKAAGIGLIVGLIVSLGAAFANNQKFINAFNTVTETVGILLSQLTTTLINVFESVTSNSKSFDALGKVMKGLLTIAVTPLKLAFFGIKLAIQQGQLAWEDSFFGGKDKDKIKQLNLSIKETKDNIFDTGVEAVAAGVGIVSNFGEAITEVGDIASKVVEEVGKISVKSAFETAKSNVAIKNSAILAVAQQTLLLEKFDRLAEKQRQIRDDDSKSISVRQAANDQLLIELDKQEKAQIRQANIQLAAANAQFKRTGLVEDEAAAIDALANKESVLAAITGFKSEQDINRIALKKEEIELNESISDAEKERRLAQLAFESSEQIDPLLKLEKQKESLELENQIIFEDLERKRLLFLEGTQARVDAEQIFLTEKERIDNELLANERQTKEESIKIEQSLADAKETIRNQNLDNISGGIRLLASLGEKSKALQAVALIADNATGIAKNIINTQASNAKLALEVPLPLLPAALLANNIRMGIGIATSVAATAKGLSALGKGGGGGGSDVPRGGQESSAPSFNLVQGTDSNQIAQSINQGNQTPTQAFVVGSAVTSQQELDANKINIGSI
jgi:hypothetical protein